MGHLDGHQTKLNESLLKPRKVAHFNNEKATTFE